MGGGETRGGFQGAAEAGNKSEGNKSEGNKSKAERSKGGRPVCECHCRLLASRGSSRLGRLGSNRRQGGANRDFRQALGYDNCATLPSSHFKF